MEATAYLLFYSLLALVLARLCLVFSLSFCILLARDEKDGNPAAKGFMARCRVLIKRITSRPFKVNLNVPGLGMAEASLAVFFAAFFALNGPLPVLTILIAFFLLADAVIDSLTELLPDSLSLALLVLFLARGIEAGFDYLHFAPYTAILCAAFLCIYIMGKGRGDMKLLASIAIGAGPVFAAASILGAFFLYAAFKIIRGEAGNRERALAPFLCGGIGMALLCGKEIESLLGF